MHGTHLAPDLYTSVNWCYLTIHARFSFAIHDLDTFFLLFCFTAVLFFKVTANFQYDINQVMMWGTSKGREGKKPGQQNTTLTTWYHLYFARQKTLMDRTFKSMFHIWHANVRANNRITNSLFMLSGSKSFRRTNITLSELPLPALLFVYLKTIT